MEGRARFVLKAGAGDIAALRRRLGRDAEVEPMADDLTLVTAEQTVSWQRIRDAVGSAEWVAPVVVDESGRPSFPTGSIGVRFREPPADGELQAFADDHGLRLLRRNEYVAEQAVFAPVDSGTTFLPDVVDRLRDDPRVQTAWPVTTSGYERVDSA
jgi:hypothetical protein